MAVGSLDCGVSGMGCCFMHGLARDYSQDNGMAISY
jgi:hypothetical protein